MPDRIAWIDIAKGVGIILVVIGHAGRGLESAGLASGADAVVLMDRAIYAFHMPLFFLLAGITFGMRPPGTLRSTLTARVWPLAYALVLWTYVFLAMRALAGGYANSGSAWGDLIVWPLPPYEHMWFLWALLLNICALSALRLVLAKVLGDVLFWSIILGVALILHVSFALPAGAAPLFGPAITYALPFAIGALIGATPMRSAPVADGLAIGCAALFALGLWASLTLALPLSAVAAGSLLSLCLLPPLAQLSRRNAGRPWVEALAYLGRISLAIFVTHTIFSAATRILLMKLGIEDLTLHLVAGVLAGLAGPLVLYRIAARFGALRLAALA